VPLGTEKSQPTRRLGVSGSCGHTMSLLSLILFGSLSVLGVWDMA
jgi:hypothetical protein